MLELGPAGSLLARRDGVEPVGVLVVLGAQGGAVRYRARRVGRGAIQGRAGLAAGSLPLNTAQRETAKASGESSTPKFSTANSTALL